MKRLRIFFLLGVAACTKHANDHSAQPSKPATPPSLPASQSAMRGKAPMEMKLIPVPKDKAQLARLVAMGYTVHQNHMHPPGVNSCPFDKKGGSVIE